MLSELLNIIERTTLREFLGDLVGVVVVFLIVTFGLLSVGLFQ